MKEMFIKKYVDMLTKEDILKFACVNNVSLSSNEVDIIYNAIKNEWKTIVFDDYKIILNKYKNNFPVEKLKKIEELILLYKNKFNM